MVAEKVDGLDVEVGHVYLLANAHLYLLAHQVGERPLDRLLHHAFHTPGDLQLARPRRAADLQPVQANLPLVVHRSGVHGAGGQRVRGDHVAPALFGNADELLLAGVVVDQGEAGLVVLEGAHLLQLLLHPATAFEGQFDQFTQLLLGELPERVNQLDQPGDDLPHCLHVAGV